MTKLYFDEKGICQEQETSNSFIAHPSLSNLIGKTYDEVMILSNKALMEECEALCDWLQSSTTMEQGLQLRYICKLSRACFSARYICNAPDKLSPARIAEIAKEGGFAITIRDLLLITGKITECRFELNFDKALSLKQEAFDEALLQSFMDNAEGEIMLEIADKKFLAYFIGDLPKALLLSIANKTGVQISFGKIKQFGKDKVCELELKAKQTAKQQSYEGYRKIIAEALHGKNVPRQAKIDEWLSLCNGDEAKMLAYIAGHIAYWKAKNLSKDIDKAEK
jgi:hypothetical protein